MYKCSPLPSYCAQVIRDLSGWFAHYNCSRLEARSLVYVMHSTTSPRTLTHIHTRHNVWGMLSAVLDYLFMQMGMTSSWDWMPPEVAGEVIEQLKWERGATAVFRRVCKGWRDAHDQCVRHLRLNAWMRISARRFNSALSNDEPLHFEIPKSPAGSRTS